MQLIVVVASTIAVLFGIGRALRFLALRFRVADIAPQVAVEMWKNVAISATIFKTK